ncbi:MAG: potassium-transporting ATPase subunit KdpC [Actinobacteria bacterium]|nr:potassium-transporting ATPase subunit KdpC [Actinomycetota bacterium]
MRALRRDLTAALVALVVLTLVLGLGYPLLVTGIAQVAFPGAANGSLVRDGAGRVIGSRLLGQGFGGRARDFQSRPSQTGYSASATAFSNAGPNDAATRAAIAASARAYLRRERPYDPALTRAAIPPDAVQTSASGVDPHISVANARIQTHRVATARGLPLARVERLIAAHTDGRALGLFGEPGVNVLTLNLALDEEGSR